MTVASGNRVQMAYAAETVFGTTDALPQMITIPMRSTTLDLSKEIINDPTIVSDRMERYERHGNYQVGGDLVVTLQHGQWDDFIEATLGGTWATNVLKVGQVARSFTIEQGFLDITQYRRFTGCRINSWSVSVAPNAVVESTFGIIGAGLTASTSPLDASMTAVVDKQPLVHIGTTITVGGSAVKATAFTMQVTNNMNPDFSIGASSAFDITSNEVNLTGSATVYFEDMVMYNRFLNETSAAISVVLTDGTNTITLAIPVAKFNGAALPVGGSGNLFVTMPFKGLFATDTVITVTRSA